MIDRRRIDWAAVQAVAAVVAAIVSIGSAGVSVTYSDAGRFERLEQHAGQLSHIVETQRRRIDRIETQLHHPRTPGRRGRSIDDPD